MGRARTTEGRLYGLMLVGAFCTALTFACCGCAGGVVYENQNGARGPEKVSLPGMAWPWPLNKGDACCAPK